MIVNTNLYTQLEAGSTGGNIAIPGGTRLADAEHRVPEPHDRDRPDHRDPVHDPPAHHHTITHTHSPPAYSPPAYSHLDYSLTD